MLLTVVGIFSFNSCQKDDGHEHTHYHEGAVVSKPFSHFRELPQLVKEVASPKEISTNRGETDSLYNFTIDSTVVTRIVKDNITYYNMAIVRPTYKPDFFENLIIVDDGRERKSYIATYYPDEEYYARLRASLHAPFKGDFKVAPLSTGRGGMDCSYVTILYCGNNQGIAGPNCFTNGDPEHIYAKTFMVCAPSERTIDVDPDWVADPNGGGGGGGTGGTYLFDEEDPNPFIVNPRPRVITQPIPPRQMLTPVQKFVQGLDEQQLSFWNDDENQESVNPIKEYLNGPNADVALAKRWLELSRLLKSNPNALLDIPCSEVQKWLALAQMPIPTSVVNKIEQLDEDSFGDYNIQYITGAKGAVVNMDYFSVKITTLPINPQTGQQFTPAGFTEYVRKNLNSFINTNYSHFSPSTITGFNEAQIWNSANPLGAIIHIDIPLPAGDGSVICSKYNSNSWVFTTIEVPYWPEQGNDGVHPVSGNREFGLFQNQDGSYTFYTRGVDRITAGLDSNIADYIIDNPFENPDALWNSLRSKYLILLKITLARQHLCQIHQTQFLDQIGIKYKDI